MTEEHSELAVNLMTEPDADDHELAELVYRLRAELLDFDVETVELTAAGQAPANAKGADLLAVGALIVRFVRHPGVLRSVVSGLRSWAARQQVSSVKLTLDGDTLEITGPHSAAQDRAVDLWIARHASPE